jgi:hypothetical protein
MFILGTCRLGAVLSASLFHITYLFSHMRKLSSEG